MDQGPNSELEQLRSGYLAALDRYDEAVSTMRRVMDEADLATRIMREHALTSAPMADALGGLPADVIRNRLSDSTIELERSRHDAQRLLFSILVGEGMTMTEVARNFGVSRSLVSRFVREQTAAP